MKINTCSHTSSTIKWAQKFNEKSWLKYLYSKDAMMAISIYIITNRLWISDKIISFDSHQWFPPMNTRTHTHACMHECTHTLHITHIIHTHTPCYTHHLVHTHTHTHTMYIHVCTYFTYSSLFSLVTCISSPSALSSCSISLPYWSCSTANVVSITPSISFSLSKTQTWWSSWSRECSQ